MIATILASSKIVAITINILSGMVEYIHIGISNLIHLNSFSPPKIPI